MLARFAIPRIMVGLSLGVCAVQAGKYQVLDFWGVGGYAHTSRVTANTYLDSLALVMGIDVVKTEDPAVFTPENLAKYRVVVLNSCTEMGKILSVDQRSALMAFIRTKGVVAWHASGDNKGSWPEYTEYLGGELSSHGAGIATVRREKTVADKSLPGGPDTARFDEEWYAYKTNPRNAPNVSVLYTMDEASCDLKCSPVMGDHPIVWARSEPTGGRMFYSGMGHFDHIFKKTEFTRTLYRQALEWAAEAGSMAIRAPAARATTDGVSAMLLGGSLEIGFAGTGFHALTLGTLAGRSLAYRAGNGPMIYRLPCPAASGPLTLMTTGPDGTKVRLLGQGR